MCFPFTSHPHLSRVFHSCSTCFTHAVLLLCASVRAHECIKVPQSVLRALSGNGFCAGSSRDFASWGMRTSPLRRLASRAALTAIPGGHIQHVILTTTAMLGRAFLSATTRARWVEASLADVFGDVPDIVRERLRRPVSAPSASGALTFFARPFARIPVLACLH